MCDTRAKRASAALKEEISPIASSSPDVKDAKAMVASKSWWGKKNVPNLAPKKVAHWDWDTAYQSLCSARAAFNNQSNSIAVPGDGGNVSEKTSFVGVWSQTGKFVAWALVQVAFARRATQGCQIL